MIDPGFVYQWSARYPEGYDEEYYFPYLQAARQGDVDALRRVTEWKNSGPDGRPRSLRGDQEAAFRLFLRGLPDYLRQDGRTRLRGDFSRRAPVWSIFWHHVLYGTPIFDMYTHIAWHWDVTQVVLSRQEATIYAPGHWPTYDRYAVWLQATLRRLQHADPSITERLLDRALVSWAQKQGTRSSRS